MKTIAQALKDQLGNSFSLLGSGMVENIMILRGLDGNKEATKDSLVSPEFIGAHADCLYALVDSANISESDISISLQNRDLILKKANLLYRAIGEEEKNLDQPTVCIGPPPGTYVSY